MGLLSLLFGCKSKSPFEKRDGTWYYREQAIAGADARNEGTSVRKTRLVDGAHVGTFTPPRPRMTRDVAERVA